MSCSKEDCGVRVAQIEEKYDKEIEWIQEQEPDSKTSIEHQAWANKRNAILNEKQNRIREACD